VDIRTRAPCKLLNWIGIFIQGGLVEIRYDGRERGEELFPESDGLHKILEISFAKPKN